MAGLPTFSTFHLALYVLLGVLGNKLARRTFPRSILSMARVAPWALGGQCSLLVVVQWQEEELAEFAGECLLVVCMLIPWYQHGSSICVLFGQYVVSSQEAKEVVPMPLRTTRFRLRREFATISKLGADRPISGWLEVNLLRINFLLFRSGTKKPTCSQDEPVFIVVVQEHRACSDRN